MTLLTLQDEPGSYNCTCDLGYMGNGFNCSDIDECQDPVTRAALEGVISFKQKYIITKISRNLGILSIKVIFS